MVTGKPLSEYSREEMRSDIKKMIILLYALCEEGTQGEDFVNDMREKYEN